MYIFHFNILQITAFDCSDIDTCEWNGTSLNMWYVWYVHPSRWMQAWCIRHTRCSSKMHAPFDKCHCAFLFFTINNKIQYIYDPVALVIGSKITAHAWLRWNHPKKEKTIRIRPWSLNNSLDFARTWEPIGSLLHSSPHLMPHSRTTAITLQFH